jgi:hypothetical protein
VRWVRNIACIRELGNAYKVLVKNLKGTNHLEGMGEDGKIILKWILNTKSGSGLD